LRQYYLTHEDNKYSGANADGSDGLGGGVCAMGYHFASLWEILDPSNLRYNINQGAMREDSGMGPPTVSIGWVRTGYNGDASSTPGQANCNGWDQDTGTGTVIGLPSDWTDASQQDIPPWDASLGTCSTSTQVWCVADNPDAPGACSQAIPIFCGQQVSENNTGMPSHIDKYSCQSWDESGPDTIYALSLPAGDTYTITVSMDDGAGDVMDVFFLGAGECYSGTCQTADTETFTVTDLAPGKYYIAVDGYNGQQGPYTLEVSCSKDWIYLPLVIGP
jgi:hypothetical protein